MELNLPVPLYRGDITVLSWYAAWKPEVHEAHWDVRRAWPAGFRYMEDLSCPGSRCGQTVERAEERMQDGPLIKGDTRHRRNGARGSLHRLLEYRMIEGHTSQACRLTARGRAALKIRGLDCPDFFESHCPEIFDDHNLLPILGRNVHIDMMDRVMSRLPPEYKVDHDEPLPDNKTTWELMLREYSEDDYRGSGTLTKASAGLRICSTTGRYLNGSLRNHHQYVSMTVQTETGHRVVECALSLEGLADLLVSQSDVPITVDYYTGQDGMSRSEPAPPPVSVTRRMRERIARGNQDIQGWIDKAALLVEGTKMGKKAAAEILHLLSLAKRDADGHGAFAAQQAMEEISSVAESMMTVMGDRAGQGSAGLLVGGEEPTTTTLLLEGSIEASVTEEVKG